MDIKFYGGDEASGNVFAVETVAPAGYQLDSHEHEHSHLSVLVSGIADVTVNGVTERIEGYKMMTVPAHTTHHVRAVTDIIWLCLWDSNLAPREQAEESLKLVKVA